MVRLPFASEMSRMFGDAYLYSAYWSARGPWPCWGYASRLGLISCEVDKDPMGHLTLGASDDPFHSFQLIRELGFRLRGLDGCDAGIRSVKLPAISQHAPGDTRELVGEGDRQLVAVHPCGCLLEPCAEAE